MFNVHIQSKAVVAHACHGHTAPLSRTGKDDTACSKSFNIHHFADRMTYTTSLCYTSRGAVAGTRNSSMEIATTELRLTLRFVEYIYVSQTWCQNRHRSSIVEKGLPILI